MTRVLLMEDDHQARALLQHMLESLGLEVFAATDGLEGLRLFRAHEIDVVVTDILMPEQEGLETIGELRRMNPDIKIVAISGGGTLLDAEDVLLHASRIGAQKTLEKPFSKADLAAALSDWITTGC